MDMFDKYKSRELFKYIAVVFGGIIYALGISLFITPANLYSGGVMGLSQLIRELLIARIGIFSSTTLDISGIIYYMLNIPLMILAFTKLSKPFFFKTLISTTTVTVAISFFRLEGAPLVEDALTASVIGGIVSGVGIGIMLRSGGSGGGLDIIGVYFAQKYVSASVGKVSLFFNAFVYILCAIMYSPAVAIYSIIYSAVNSQAVDKVHYQNIMIQAMIFTKVNDIAKPIMETLNRGVTEWEGDGAYTHEATHILCTAVSKYEMSSLRRIVHENDPKAFIIYNKAYGIDGNFRKKLS